MTDFLSRDADRQQIADNAQTILDAMAVLDSLPPEDRAGAPERGEVMKAACDIYHVTGAWNLAG